MSIRHPSRSRARRGSALLVVLGLLAFMVVSGIAFSSFTRYQRLPSSFLRRAVATRQLAKAALAEAIERVDVSIGDDPYPNRRPPTSTDKEVVLDEDSDDASAKAYYGNYWRGRVFIGERSAFDGLSQFSGLDLDGKDDDFQELTDAGCATPGNTVTTFPFEGLAYIPPALANDARFFARRTPTAIWAPFTFDSGRYCFSCIDVSDCFDVNRLLADWPRASSAQRRISLGYIFEEGFDHYAPGSATLRWDKWLDELRDVDNTGAIEFPNDKVPLVSVADWNLSLYSKSSAGFDSISSLFCNYVKDQKWNANGFFNCSAKVQAQDAFEKRANEMFVTDGYFPLTPEEEQEIADSNGGFDLTANQPFKPQLMKNSEGQGLAPLLSFQPVVQSQRKHWQKFICGMGVAALFDYLDEDSEPVSLVMPTTERVPMVCGVQLKADFTVAVQHLKNPDASGKEGEDANVAGTRQEIQNGYTIQKQHVDEYRLDSTKFAGAISTARVYPVLVFPFLPDGSDEAKEDAQEEWTLDGRLSLFFSTDMNEGSSVLGNKSHVGTRVQVADGYLHPKNDEEYGAEGLLKNSVIALPLKKQTFAFQGIRNGVSAKDPYANFTVDSDTVGFSFNQSDAKAVREALEANNGAAARLLRVTYRWVETHVTDPETGKETVTPKQADLLNQDGSYKDQYLYAAQNMLRPIDCDGNIQALSISKQDINDNVNIAQAIKDMGTIMLKAAVFIRVRNGEEIADLVPAGVNDDIALLGAPTSQKKPDCTRCGGYGYPLLKFNLGTIPIPFTPGALMALKTQAQVVSPSPNTYLCADPRWNHAPEDWFVYAGAQIPLTKREWYDNCGCSEDGRDGDIFMATSDRGYLQSIYELAFIPRLTEFDAANQGDTRWGDLRDKDAESGKNGEFAKEWELDVPEDLVNHSFKVCKHSSRFWRTYRPYSQGTNCEADDFDALGITCGTEGWKVNPYSDCTNVILAAFANTPFNWRVASTNITIKPKPDYMSKWTTKIFNTKHAWNAFGDMTWRRFEWQDVQDFAGSFMKAIDDVVQNPPDANAWGINWREALAVQAWHYKNGGGDPEDLGSFWGVDLPDETVVTSVDRRYLYGFWRDSFAARQQLLLFFIRAEPMMMGGGIANTAPPQLSSRAVALVWRDPSKPNNPNGGTTTNPKTGAQQAPHRSRILFYYQFE